MNYNRIRMNSFDELVTCIMNNHKDNLKEGYIYEMCESKQVAYLDNPKFPMDNKTLRNWFDDKLREYGCYNQMKGRLSYDLSFMFMNTVVYIHD